MLIKQRTPSLPRNLSLGTLGELVIVLSTKLNLLYLLYSTTRRCCFLDLIKQNRFLKTPCKISNLDDSGISLPVFSSRTNLKQHNISVIPKMVKNVITNLDLTKASGPDSIPVVVLKNCVPQISYALAELFNMYLKEFRFPDCSKVSSVVSIFKNVGERSTAKNYRSVASLLSMVSKVFKNLSIIGLLIIWRNVTFFLIKNLSIIGLLITWRNVAFFLIKNLSIIGL